MTNILLLQPPVSYTNHAANSGQNDYPIGLSYLSSALKTHGFSFRTINNSNAILSIRDILDLIEAEQVKIVGLSALLSTIRSVVQLAEAIKVKFDKKIHVVMGNAYPCIDSTIAERYPYFDSLVTGEADRFVVEHFTNILEGSTRCTGVFHATAPDNLDALPFPAYECIENTNYKRGSLLPIIGTRGCPFLCGFCSRPALSKKVRHRSPENLIAEIEMRLPLTRRFFFQDDSATIKRNHVVAFAREVIKRGLKIKFEMTTRLDLIDEEMVELLRRAGCSSLLLGVESGNERIRNQIIQKRLSDEALIEGMRVTKKVRMPVQLFMMIGHPDETEAEIHDSIQLPLRLEKMGFTHIEAVGYHVTLPIPGTRYFDWCVSKGKISKNLVDDYITGKLGDGYFGHWPYLVPDGLTTEDLLRFRSIATRTFHMRPRYIARRLWRDLLHPVKMLANVQHGLSVLTYGTAADRTKRES